MRRLAVLLATGFGLGRFPIAPATWGSAATALVLLPLMPRLPLLPYLILTLAVTALAVYVCGEAEKSLGHDARPIVADEIAGMMITMCGVPAFGGAGPPYGIALLIGFVLFRMFDVWKPPPVDRAQALPGGFGVVMDDVLAGVYANLVLHLLARVWR